MTYTRPASIDEAIELLVAGHSERNPNEERLDRIDILGKSRVVLHHWRYAFLESSAKSNLRVCSVVDKEPFMALLTCSLGVPTTQLPDGHGVSEELHSCNSWESSYGAPTKEHHCSNDRPGIAIIHIDWSRHESAFPLTVVPSLDAPWPTLGFIEDRDYVPGRGRITLPTLRKALRLGWCEQDPPNAPVHTYHHFVTEAHDKATFEYRYHFDDSAMCEEQRETESIIISRSDYDTVLKAALEGGRCDMLCKALVSHTTQVVRSTYGREEPKTTENVCDAAIMINVDCGEPRFATDVLGKRKVLG